MIIAALALLSLAACGDDVVQATSSDLSFTDVWSRQPVEGQSTAAVYATVANSGATDVRITGVSTEVTDRAELHTTTTDDGVMTMSEQPDGFVVPAGGTFTFEPGGPHVMLMGVDPSTYPSDAIDVTFSFDAGDEAFVTATIREITGDLDAMDHGDMDHGDDMEMDDAEMDDSDG